VGRGGGSMVELHSSLAPPAPWTLAIGIPLVMGALAWALRVVRRSAFLAGVPAGVLVLKLGGLAGFLVLTAFFLLGTALTRFGFSAKEARGVAEEAGGRRGASHVLANCGLGLLLLIAGAVFGITGAISRVSAAGTDEVGATGAVLLWAAFVGSFATAASDTSSSEIGQLYGRHPISLRTFRPVPIGTQGAVSLEGLLAGLAAAGIMAGVGRAVGFLDGWGWVAVTAGGFLGNVMESLAGTWGRRFLPHGLLNFTNTAVGATLAAALTALR